MNSVILEAEKYFRGKMKVTGQYRSAMNAMQNTEHYFVASIKDWHRSAFEVMFAGATVGEHSSPLQNLRGGGGGGGIWRFL
jgi:hypothetical protein